MEYTLKEIFNNCNLEFEEEYQNEKYLKHYKVKRNKEGKICLSTNTTEILAYLMEINKHKVFDAKKITNFVLREYLKDFTLSKMLGEVTLLTPGQMFKDYNTLKTKGLLDKIGIKNYKLIKENYYFDVLENKEMLIKYLNSLITKKIKVGISDMMDEAILNSHLKYSKCSKEERNNYYYNLLIEWIESSTINLKKESESKMENISLIDQIESIKEALIFREEFKDYTIKELKEMISKQEKIKEIMKG